MNFDDFKYAEKNLPKNYARRRMYYEELKNTFYEVLKSSKAHEEFFKGFDPDSVDSFMHSYAARKAHLAEYYKIISSDTFQYKELKYREQTEKVFEYILQKKLFNMQLRWRAREIDLHEVRTTWDFHFWETHIHSCPFIPPVTKEEVDLMKQFLLDSNYHDQTENWFSSWQNYDMIIEPDEEGRLSLMPEWYEYYDAVMGTGVLLQLPNLRGEKEEYYAHLGRTFFHEEAQKNPRPTTPYRPAPPYLHASFEDMYNYAAAFEGDKHFIELFRIEKEKFAERESYSEYNDDDIDEAVELLKEADHPVIMEGGMDWRDAIMQCAEKYLNSIVAEELNFVYEEYILFSNIGLSKNPSDEEIQKEYDSDDILQFAMKNILKGRELCGEPQDFNY